MNTQKIERKKKLQKYMNILRPKRKSEDLTYTLKQEQESLPTSKKHLAKQVKHLNEDNEPIWQDPDDETKINLQEKNISKKFIKGETIISQAEYSKRTQQFYTSKQQQHFTSWATEGDAGLELEQNNVFEEEFQMLTTKQTTFDYLCRAPMKHNSVVSDICWVNNNMVTVGLDKFLAWNRINVNLLGTEVITYQKYHFKDLPLTTCAVANNKVFIGTLRKNYAIFDIQKQSHSLYSSTFLAEHKNYANLRASGKVMSIFSNKLISIFQTNNQFIRQLQTNQPITDVCIEGHDIIATTKNSIYRWDNRTNQIMQVLQTGLNNTCVSIVPQNDTLLVGTFSGVIYNHRLNPSMKQVIKQIPNLTTSVTGISHDSNGELIVAYSKWKKNALRVIEAQTQKVVQSWPSVSTRLNFPTTARFSNIGSLLATGSSNGNVNVYKIQH